MQLVCPAGSLPALKSALRQGVDAIHVGFRDNTNAHHFASLNPDERQLQEGLWRVHEAGRQLYVAVNTYFSTQGWERWQRAMDQAADLGVDALTVADVAVFGYAAKRHPRLNLRLLVQDSAANVTALALYRERYGIHRVVLPRVLSLAQVRQVAAGNPVPMEVFAFDSLCITVEGRCHLSSYVTGESPNLCDVCSPARAVRWSEKPEGLTSRLNEVLIDRYAAGEAAGYPTPCKGRFLINGQRFHTLEEPTSLNTLDLVPQLAEIGVTAVKIEGRQCSPAYVEQVTRVWCQALGSYASTPGAYSVQPQWQRALAGLSEGHQTTLGAYHRSWQ